MDMERGGGINPKADNGPGHLADTSELLSVSAGERPQRPHQRATVEDVSDDCDPISRGAKEDSDDEDMDDGVQSDQEGEGDAEDDEKDTR